MMNTMKRPSIRRPISVAKSLVICAGLLLLLPSARAVEPSPQDAVARTLGDARSATSAEVFIVPNTLSTGKQIDQDEVPKYGCRYPVNKVGMSELFDILDRGGIKPSDTGPRRPDLRVLIRLFHDGGVTALAFKEGVSPGDDMVHGFVNGMRVTAAAHFPESIRRWAAGVTPKPPQKFMSCP